jgi:uncharacterized protein YfaS (alpha-2-macroglobulin family)
VRLFAENDRAGVYHVYYPAIATVAGEFGMPGARMEFLYSPEIYATSGSTTVRVLRGEE